MVDRLLEYQRKYGSLNREEQVAHIHALDTDQTLRKEVAELAQYFLHRKVSNCGWCYIEFDLLLKRITKDQMEKKTLAYELLPGTVLHDPINKEFSKLLTPGTMTEELALYHIAFNKNAMKYFVRVPADLEERLANFLNNTEVEADARQAGEIRVEAIERQLALAKKGQATAKKAYDEATALVAKLERQLEEAQEAFSAVAIKGRVKADEKPADEKPADEKPADEKPADEFLAAAKEDVATYVAAGMTNKEIEDAFAEALADKKVTKSQLVKFAAEARATTGDGAPADDQGAAEGDGASATDNAPVI